MSRLLLRTNLLMQTHHARFVHKFPTVNALQASWAQTAILFSWCGSGPGVRMTTTVAGRWNQGINQGNVIWICSSTSKICVKLVDALTHLYWIDNAHMIIISKLENWILACNNWGLFTNVIILLGCQSVISCMIWIRRCWRWRSSGLIGKKQRRWPEQGVCVN